MPQGENSYKQGKDSVQFPLDKPIPYELIKIIVEYRVEENSKPLKTKLSNYDT
jgi:uncharacterized protein YdhG (YjbR/CyaY superfamily)